MIDDLEDVLLNSATPVADGVWLWATVTSASPLRVRIDGDTAALVSTPSTLISGQTYTVGQRVRVQIHGRLVVVYSPGAAGMTLGALTITGTPGSNNAVPRSYVDGVIRLESHAETDAPSAYSTGVTVNETAGAWSITSLGTILTVKQSGNRGFQQVFPKGSSTVIEEPYIRTMIDDSTWSPWGRIITNRYDFAPTQSKLTMGTNFSHYTSSGWGGLRLGRSGNTISIFGAVVNNSGWAAGATVATINDANVRPGYKVPALAGSTGEVDFNTDGTITIGASGTSAIRIMGYYTLGT